MTTLYHSERITRSGLEFRVEYHSDPDLQEPWKEHDGHGPVTDWTARDKRPGELVLNTACGSKCFYDFAEACRIARRDGWDAPPYKQGTARERAARAAMADYLHLKAWCDNQWHWCGVVVKLLDDEGEEVSDASLWGMETSDREGLEQAAADLADELAASAADSLRALAQQHTTKAAAALAQAAQLR